jgi:dTDP-4-dehydrorhamnose reductase
MPILRQMVDKGISGTFNMVNKGTISPLEVAKILKKEINPEMEINETTLDEVNANLVAKRCSTVLDTTALETVGFNMRPVGEAILSVVKEFKKNLDEAGGLSALDKVREETRKKYTITQDKPTTYTEKN